MRKTSAAIEIQNLIRKSKVALSHHEIQEALKGLCDRVTIYRVLERLVEAGQIHKIVNIDGVLKFANCNNCNEAHDHNHVHFSCRKCGSVVCLEQVKSAFTLPSGYIAHEVNCVISGVCAQCS